MKRLILIDLSGLFWAAWHATEHQPVGEAYARTVEQVRRAVDGYDYAAVCCDAPPYKRREIFPEYKATRDAHPPQALQQLDDVKQRCADDGLLVWSVPGFEADDVIATATRFARAEETPIDVTIFSADKDLLQLVGDGVRCVSPRSGTYGPAEVEAKFGVPPRLMGDLLALWGDDSDNIPGIPSVGVKTAAKLLQDFGSLGGVLGGALAIKGDSLREKVIAGADTARLARQCIELVADVPLDWDAIFAKREPKRIVPKEDLTNMDEEDTNAHDEPWASPEPEADTEPPRGPKGEPTPPTRALAKIDANATALAPRTFEQGLEPMSLGGAYKLACGMHQSKLYSRFPTPEAVWAVMIRGREMGLGALTSLDCFHVIEGKPAPHAHLIIARAKAHPDCEYLQMVEEGADFCIWETKNRNNPSPTRLRYSFADAQAAGVVKPGGNWIKRKAEMLRKTCGVQLARLEYPDAALGLYAVEELTDDD